MRRSRAVTGESTTKRSRTRVSPSSSMVTRTGPRSTRAVSTRSGFGRKSSHNVAAITTVAAIQNQRERFFDMTFTPVP